jgi:hypothetical protein
MRYVQACNVHKGDEKYRILVGILTGSDHLKDLGMFILFAKNTETSSTRLAQSLVAELL